MMVLRRLFIHRFLYVPLRVQLHALRFHCSVPLSMANLREPVYSPNVGEGSFSEVRGLGRLRLRIQETHGSHLGPRIEPEVLYSLIL
jgi:hypothetical protein